MAKFQNVSQNDLFRNFVSASIYFAQVFQARPPARGSETFFHFGILAPPTAGLAMGLKRVLAPEALENFFRISCGSGRFFGDLETKKIIEE